jgi:hypothetical protein
MFSGIPLKADSASPSSAPERYSAPVRCNYGVNVDRLGRSLHDLVKFLSEIHALKVDLYLHQQGLETTTPAGRAMFQMMGVFAEFERAMIQDRVRAGLARAKAEGKQLGRPKVDEKTENAIRKALGRKDRPGILKITKELGVGTSTFLSLAAGISDPLQRAAQANRGRGHNDAAPDSRPSIRRRLALSLHLCCFYPPHQIVGEARERPFEGLAAFARRRTISREGLSNNTNSNRA